MERIFSQFLNDINSEIESELCCSKPYMCGVNIPKKVKFVLREIDENRNHSWAVEMFQRNKNNLNNVALFYRGTKITYKEMFEKSYIYAKSLKSMGFNRGDEIPICVTNTPEFVYLFLATSFIGCKSNVIGDWFEENYLTQILNKTNSKTIFIDDISYSRIKKSIKNSSIKNIVCLSLSNSLEKFKGNPYNEIDSQFHRFGNGIEEIILDYSGNVFDAMSFEQIGKKVNKRIIENCDLDDICSITYTSGTTTPGQPKGVKQSNRSYITLSRFKESDVSGMPTMQNISVLGHIPTYTHMELSCAISDTLYCGCTLCLEPFYSKDFFPYSLMINKPNFVPAGVGFWIYLGKLLNFDSKFQNINMPYLMLPTVTGEGLSQGEEKFLNLTSRKHKFGTAKLPFPLAPVTFSIGGGTTESSGIFATLFKALQEKNFKYIIKKQSLGLTPLKFAEIEILRPDGTYCDINEPGQLVAINPCEMSGYTNEELNKTTHIKDAYGKIWLNLGTYSYKDGTGRIKMKGRMNNYFQLSNGQRIPYYIIEDCISIDTKNIMSCSVVNDDEGHLISHIEFQPYKQASKDNIMKGIISRIDKSFSNELKNVLFIRVRDFSESFPLDPSGKRSLSTLSSNGIDEITVSYKELSEKYLTQGKAKTIRRV